jgi:dynamin-binding protein
MSFYVPLAPVVDVPPAVRRPPKDGAPKPLSLQAMSNELVPATRSPRSPPPPTIPARNPLRRRDFSIRNDDDDDDRPLPPAISPFRMQIVQTHSLPLLSTVKTISVGSSETINVDEKSFGKSFSESPIMLPLSPVDVDDGESSTGSSSILNNAMSSPPPTISKRNHALLELLSSERAYASDLALILDIHMSLALGE